MSIQRIDVSARYSEAVIVNGLAFFSGMVPNIESSCIKEQTLDVLDQIEQLLKRIGSDKTKIIDATIYLANLDDYAGMNEIWDAWFVAGHAPARVTVEAKLAKPEWKVEIKVVVAV